MSDRINCIPPLHRLMKLFFFSINTRIMINCDKDFDNFSIFYQKFQYNF